MKKFIILAALVAVAVAAYITNPSDTDHRRAMRRELNAYMDHYVEEKTQMKKGVLAHLNSAIASVAKPAIWAYVEENVARRDYYLFSLTTLRAEGKDNIAGIGAFGYVYVPHALWDVLDEKLGLAGK